MFSGAFAALETASFAVGPGVFALILAVTGFTSSTFDEPARQGGAALNGIAIGFSLVPALLIAATLPLIGRYARTDAARVGVSGNVARVPECSLGWDLAGRRRV